MSCYPSKTPQNGKFAIHFSCFKAKFFLRLSRSYICQRKGSCFLLVPLPFSGFHIFHHFLIYICFDPLLCLECLLYSLHSSTSKDLMKANPPENLTLIIFLPSLWLLSGILASDAVRKWNLKGPAMLFSQKNLKCVASDCSYVESIQRRPEYILKKVFFKKLVFSVRSIDPWL